MRSGNGSVTSPPVGWPVQFFLSGARGEPQVGHVVASGDNGMVRVNYQHPHGGEVRSTRGFVPHVDDPVLAEHQAVRKKGAWDFVPGLPYSPKPSKSSKTEN